MARSDTSRRDELSPREIEVLELRSRGVRNKEIAARLGITERTIKSHITSMRAVAGCRSGEQMALWAIERGYLERRPAAGTKGPLASANSRLKSVVA